MDSRSDIKNKLWLSHWNDLRKLGLVRYSIMYGCFYFGLSLTIFLLLLYGLSKIIPPLNFIVFNNVIANILMAIALGVGLSLVRWLVNELRFRRLGARYPHAVKYL